MKQNARRNLHKRSRRKKRVDMKAYAAEKKSTEAEKKPKAD